MKGCHSCQFKSAVDAGKYRNTPWEKTPCASCKLSEGGHAVEYDEDRAPLEPDTGYGNMDKGISDEDSTLPVDVMIQFVNGLMKLPPPLRDVVAMRFQGMKYQEIADILNVTMACAEKRHRRALESWPALREMFPEKVAKRKRREKRGKK